MVPGQIRRSDPQQGPDYCLVFLVLLSYFRSFCVSLLLLRASFTQLPCFVSFYLLYGFVFGTWNTHGVPRDISKSVGTLSIEEARKVNISKRCNDS